MPLKKGTENIGSNISEMEEAGYPHKQALAAALHTAYGDPLRAKKPPKKRKTVRYGE